MYICRVQIKKFRHLAGVAVAVAVAVDWPPTTIFSLAKSTIV